jgi:hypothetical protein
MRKISLLLALVASLIGSQAFADFTAKNAAGTTITFKNPTDCTAGTCVPEAQIVDSTGAAVVGTTTDAVATVPASGAAATAMSLFKAIVNTLNSILTAVQSSIPSGTNVIGFISNDPCSQATKAGTSINLTGSAQIIAGTSAKKTYICAMNLVTAGTSIAMVEGTGSTCATNIFALIGGTTAATGLPLLANNGLTLGSGAGTVVSPSADANAAAANVCLLYNGNAQTSGHVSYVQQ